VDLYFHLPHMASWHGCWLSTGMPVPPSCTLNVVMLVSYPHSVHVFSSDTVQCVTTGGILLPSSGWFNLNEMTSHNQQFGCGAWLGWQWCLALPNLTSVSGFTTSNQIIFWQSVYIKRYKKILLYLTTHNTLHSDRYTW